MRSHRLMTKAAAAPQTKAPESTSMAAGRPDWLTEGGFFNAAVASPGAGLDFLSLLRGEDSSWGRRLACPTYRSSRLLLFARFLWVRAPAQPFRPPAVPFIMRDGDPGERKSNSAAHKMCCDVSTICFTASLRRCAARWNCRDVLLRGGVRGAITLGICRSGARCPNRVSVQPRFA